MSTLKTIIMKKQLLYVFLVFGISFVQAQERKITGKVKDASGVLPGVSVFIKGTTNGTETDFGGNYSLKASEGEVLIFAYLGYKTVERKIGKSSIVNVELEEDSNVLDEVVVSGYATESRMSSSTSLKRYSPQSGQLTAGEINDHDKWKNWLNLNKDKNFIKIIEKWNLVLQDKIEVYVKDNDNKAIVNATVLLSDENNRVIGKTKTDVFGNAVLFKNDSEFFTVQVIYQNKIKGLKIVSNYNKANFSYDFNEEKHDLDVMFTIDATGSMGDEIDYLKSEIENIITRVDSSIQEKRIGLTFYRDTGDEYIVRDFNFTTNISTAKKNLMKQNANGGGDYEEAVVKALNVSLSKSWNEDAKTKLLFLLLDAPPHLTQENIAVIKTEIKRAQKKGIKIIPIVASGADKTVEYLMRYFSVRTNGTYVFLTDDSGIGNSHIKPTVEEYKVEKLNDLIIRLIEKYSGV